MNMDLPHTVILLHHITSSAGLSFSGHLKSVTGYEFTSFMFTKSIDHTNAQCATSALVNPQVLIST